METRERQLTEGSNAVARLLFFAIFSELRSRHPARVHTISTPSQDLAIVFRLRL